MLFLIDYENVGNAGMKGSDYLNAQDHVIVFYSEARTHMATLQQFKRREHALCVDKSMHGMFQTYYTSRD